MAAQEQPMEAAPRQVSGGTPSGRTWRGVLMETEERIAESRQKLSALWETHAETLVHLRTRPAAFGRTAVGLAHIALSIDEEEHNLGDLIEYRDWITEVIRDQRGAA